MGSSVEQDRTDSQLSELVRFQADTLVLAAKIDDYHSKLSASEKNYVNRAVDSRRREFSTGRWLARKGLTRLGVPNFEILPDSNRQPVWPNGIVGSITHTRDYAVVALARRLHYLSIGIDLEKKNRIEPEIVSSILTEREQSEYSTIDPTLVFSAKEAVYKLIFPLTDRQLDFLDVEILFDYEAGVFYPQFLSHPGRSINTKDINGCFTTFHGHWLTFLSLPCGPYER